MADPCRSDLYEIWASNEPSCPLVAADSTSARTPLLLHCRATTTASPQQPHPTTLLQKMTLPRALRNEQGDPV
ncbi:hypothetical protein Pmani_010861 [Petrolisthes manimaculis]|uniref:Uncharacterized protein n=1 Tax=Petrolisthes manimaculis TaxID=1843537 RepID=A0AAE1Q0P8_9EUCA|nr:hypothetical protein Pmani_010861 [Petrolisthes manimaculis]